MQARRGRGGNRPGIGRGGRSQLGTTGARLPGSPNTDISAIYPAPESTKVESIRPTTFDQSVSYAQLGDVMSSLTVKAPIAIRMGLISGNVLERTSAANIGVGGLKELNDPSMGSQSPVVPCSFCQQPFTYCPSHTGSIRLSRRIIHPLFIKQVIYILQAVCNSCGELLLSEQYLSDSGLLDLTGEVRLRSIADMITDKKTRTIVCTNRKDIGKYQQNNVPVDDRAGGLLSPVRSDLLEGAIISCGINPYYDITRSVGSLTVNYRHGQTPSDDNDMHPMKVNDIRAIFDMISDRTAKLLGFSDVEQIHALILRNIAVVPPTLRPYSEAVGKNNNYLNVVYSSIMSANSVIAKYKADIRGLRNNLPNGDFDENSPSYNRYLRLKRDIEEKERMLATYTDMANQNFSMDNPVNELVNKLKMEIRLMETRATKLSNKIPRKSTPQVLHINSKISDLYTKINDSSTTLAREVLNLYVTTNKETNASRKSDTIGNSFKGKKNVLRDGTMGKRVDLSARTVVSPSPDLEFGQIHVPRIWASSLVIPVCVNSENQDELINLARQGRIKYIQRFGGGHYGIRTSYNHSKDPLDQFKLGDIVSRYLQNGDYVIMNRQPTLHKQNFFSFQVILTDTDDERTVRVHLSVVGVYNMDFDGDEANIFLPVTPEAMAEVIGLMAARRNIINGQTNRPNFGLAYDAIPGASLATTDGNMVTPGMIDWAFKRIVSPIDRADWEQRCRKHKIDPLSGRAFFSICLPHDFTYEKGSVKIEDGIVISGRLESGHVSSASGSIVEEIFFNYGNERAADFLTDGTFLAVRSFTHYGSTIRITDFMGSDQLYKQLDQIFDQTQQGIYDLGPRRVGSFKDTRWNEAVDTLVGQARNDISNAVTDVATNPSIKDNQMMRLVEVGAKGSIANATQSIGALGQQYVFGSRPSPNLAGRYLVYCLHGDFRLESMGFIVESFFQGLSLVNFVTHQMGARVTALDTALRTAPVGQIHRLIVKATETNIASRGMVLDHNGKVIEFVYGGDGLVPTNTRIINMDILNGDSRVPFVMNVPRLLKLLS